MRDYENTAKALRCCRLTSARGCAKCPFSLNSNEKCANLLPDAADAIEELLAAVPTWISVEDVLPDEWREVLTYSPIHSDEKNPHMIQLCWYIGFGKWRECQYGEIVEITITHWMPLPEPPKEDAE